MKELLKIMDVDEIAYSISLVSLLKIGKSDDVKLFVKAWKAKHNKESK